MEPKETTTNRADGRLETGRIGVKTLADMDCKELVLMPRTQKRGVEPAHVERNDFEPQAHDVEGMGRVWTLRQRVWPHVVLQVTEARSETHFDRLLGTALGLKRWAEYVEGSTDFLVLSMGTEERIDWTGRDIHAFMADVHETIRQAARWWHEYRREVTA